jgi:hypothetical protein
MTSLLDEYRRHAVDHGVFTAEGDANGINKSYDQLRRVFVSLVNEGKGNELFRFYDDVDPCVQCWAAAHTLEINESRALAKLGQLQNAGIPHVSTGAKYTIQEWKNGELRFLPPHLR